MCRRYSWADCSLDCCVRAAARESNCVVVHRGDDRLSFSSGFNSRAFFALVCAAWKWGRRVAALKLDGPGPGSGCAGGWCCSRAFQISFARLRPPAVDPIAVFVQLFPFFLLSLPTIPSRSLPHLNPISLAVHFQQFGEQRIIVQRVDARPAVIGRFGAASVALRLVV